MRFFENWLDKSSNWGFTPLKDGSAVHLVGYVWMGQLLAIAGEIQRPATAWFCIQDWWRWCFSIFWVTPYHHLGVLKTYTASKPCWVWYVGFFGKYDDNMLGWRAEKQSHFWWYFGPGLLENPSFSSSMFTSRLRLFIQSAVIKHSNLRSRVHQRSL